MYCAYAVSHQGGEQVSQMNDNNRVSYEENPMEEEKWIKIHAMSDPSDSAWKIP